MSGLSLAISASIAFGSYLAAVRLIPQFSEMFIKANLFGRDLCKKDKEQIPESLGVVVGCFFLVAMFLFIPIPFTFNSNLIQNVTETEVAGEHFSEKAFVELVVALLSICCMLLLGFADDVLDLRWRHKLLLPTIASLPLLMVYYVNSDSTTILLPAFARSYFGTSLNIGIFFYIYMGMLAVFCTNAINILAGINGLEVGQSIVISASILAFNLIEYTLGHKVDAHALSMYLMLPFLAVSLALWKYNKYPSQVFVGDTYCYFAGMTFAAVGILGHFSKTLILFFMPQILNFLYSIPQLFYFIPCPRHRLPRYDPKSDLLHISTTEFQLHELNPLGRLMVHFLRITKLISWSEQRDGKVVTNNLTLINFVLVVFGPVHEKVLTQMLIGLQLICTLIAFTIRYSLERVFYTV